jgi:prophage antirepressor-like protein
MSSLIPFSFESSSIRVITHADGNWSVVAKDVCDVLGYVWAGIATISHVPEEWRGVNSVQTPRGEQEMLTFAEPGLYFFLGRSDKPKAMPFQKWIFGDVAPSIRKTGSYAFPGASSNPILAAQLAELLKGKVLVDFEKLQVMALALQSVSKTALSILEEQLGDLSPSKTEPYPVQYASIFGRPEPRLSVRDQVLAVIAKHRHCGIRLAALPVKSWSYRQLSPPDRQALLQDLLDSGEVVFIAPEPTGKAGRQPAGMLVAKAYAQKAN